MAQAGMVVAASMYDRQKAILVEPLEPHHRRVEPETVRNLDNLPLADSEIRPRPIVRRIAEGDDGVETVVATGELDHDENALRVLLDARPLQRLRGKSRGCPIQDR